MVSDFRFWDLFTMLRDGLADMAGALGHPDPEEIMCIVSAVSVRPKEPTQEQMDLVLPDLQEAVYHLTRVCDVLSPCEDGCRYFFTESEDGLCEYRSYCPYGDAPCRETDHDSHDENNLDKGGTPNEHF